MLNKTREVAALRKDGSEFPVELSISGAQIGGAWHAIGIVRDITKRMRLSAETEYRSRLLHAVSLAAKELLTTSTIEVGMAKVLEAIGGIMRADRMLVLEVRSSESAAVRSALRYYWRSSGGARDF